MPLQENIDWSQCPLVEVKPGVQGGAPVLRGTRMPVSAIVDNFDCGVSVAEIAEQFEIPIDSVEAILAWFTIQRAWCPNPQPRRGVTSRYAATVTPAFAYHGLAGLIAAFTASIFFTPSVLSQSSSAFAPCLP
jgi:uncharacterized protein (DUF433 family)